MFDGERPQIIEQAFEQFFLGGEDDKGTQYGKFFPKPAEIADIIRRIRVELRMQGNYLKPSDKVCTLCNGTKWVPAGNGRVKRCECPPSAMRTWAAPQEKNPLDVTELEKAKAM